MFRKPALLVAGIVVLAGLASAVNALTPIPAVKVSGGEDHTLILTESHEVWSCGRNYLGGLGDGTYEDRYVPVPVYDGDMNTPSDCLENISAIAAGWLHSLARDENGYVWAWGGNGNGQLGVGDLLNRAVPVQVRGGQMQTTYLQNIVAITAGRSGRHSLAVDVNHFVWSWGINDYGQLGNNKGSSEADSNLLPIKVHGVNDVNYLANIVSVSGGAHHSMALDANGCVYTWGDNSYGEFYPGGYGKLGINNTVIDKIATPVKVHGVNDVNYLQNIIAIAAGWDHSMALEKIDHNDPNCQGRVYTWGYNDTSDYTYGGRLGNGEVDGDSPVPIRVLAGQQDPNHPTANLRNIISIKAGEGHCMALEKFDANDSNCKGRVYTWGDNSYGQLGNGTTYHFPTPLPVKVVGPNSTGYLKDIVFISAGYWHNLAVDKWGTVWVWGKGSNGRLGIGPANNINTPTPLHVYEVNVHNKTQNKWYRRVQPAVNEANNNDVIEVNEGYYCENINFNNKPITLKGQDPNNMSVVDRTRLYGSSRLTDKGVEIRDPIIHMLNNNGSVVAGLSIIAGGNGITCASSNPTISHCNIWNNVYNGIYISGISSAPTIINNMIHHNGSDGGISISGGSSTRIRNNTIAENYWYGIYSLGVDPNIYSNIVWGNNAGSLVGDTFTKIHFNCIQNYTGGGLHNITSDPCFGNPDTSNYHLKYGSPCINKGDPNFSSSTETDIDGEPRIMASEHNGTARVDMGADEFYRHPADFLPYDGVVNFLDFNVLAESWMISEGQPGYDDICDLNNDGTIDYKDLEIFCESWLWVADWRLDN